MARKPKVTEKTVATLRHAESRLNNPTAELASLFEQQADMEGDEREMRVPRDRPLAQGETRPRDADSDPQIVWSNAKVRLTQAQLKALAKGEEIDLSEAQLTWRGKDAQDWSDLVVNAPPIYVQEKIHPKAVIDDLKRNARKRDDAPDLFADFNGLDDPEAVTEFYQHPKHWQNRMILGDSLQVMASLAEREALKGKVQCIYFDPPYGIKFNSNWQVSTMAPVVKDGKVADVSREPEQVKAFRDTWKDGIHSYLTYLRDRLSVARELLTESGSIFVQISDENVHRVRTLMDEIFGDECFISLITTKKSGGMGQRYIDNVSDFILWYCKDISRAKYRPLVDMKNLEEGSGARYRSVQLADGSTRPLLKEELKDIRKLPEGARIFLGGPMTSETASKSTTFSFDLNGRLIKLKKGGWKTNLTGVERLKKADRLFNTKDFVNYKLFFDDFAAVKISNLWEDTMGTAEQNKVYVVQTVTKVIQRCILMTTDPGDLVFDPTCGSGTTAFVAEQWGRRWITVDTSRVALALARGRLMGAQYPFYQLADSKEGRAKEAELQGRILPDVPSHNDVRQGFVYERVPHIMLNHIANNAEIDVIYDQWQTKLEPLRVALNAALHTSWEEWQIPRDLDVWLDSKEAGGKAGLVTKKVRDDHAAWWEARIKRQRDIDASIARAADVELLYDRPYEDKSKVRVAGPFTVESLSPHRVVASREDTLAQDIGLVEGAMQAQPKNVPEADFAAMVLDNLKTSGVHQQAKADTIRFTSLEPWPGVYIAALGTYDDGAGVQRRAGVLIGPEFGTLSRSQITAAAREASDARFDALVACAFAFDAHASDLTKLGPLAILKARMNPDLQMAKDLKNTGKGNLFVVFGEPDVELIRTKDGEIQVKVHGVDVFDPSTGDIRSDGVDGIAAWFIDTDYNDESFFVRHAYFLGSAKSGGSDPYKSLKTALKAEIDEEAWATLYSDVSRPFPRPREGKIAVKVINHFGDEVLKVFGV